MAKHLLELASCYFGISSGASVIIFSAHREAYYLKFLYKHQKSPLMYKSLINAKKSLWPRNSNSVALVKTNHILYQFFRTPEHLKITFKVSSL